MDEIRQLASAIRERAAALVPPLPVIESPLGMLARRLWAEDVAERLGDAQGSSTEEEALPDDVVALGVGYHRLLIGSLGDSPSPDHFLVHLQRLQDQAAIAWSWLGGEGEDLLLFLVGPPGSVGNPAWERIRAEIERNEQVCRKLIWLPSAAEAERGESVKRFLARTFLAYPWLESGAGAQGVLDRLSVQAKSLASGDFTEAEAVRWLKILGRDNWETADMAAELVKALEPAS